MAKQEGTPRLSDPKTRLCRTLLCTNLQLLTYFSSSSAFRKSFLFLLVSVSSPSLSQSWERLGISHLHLNLVHVLPLPGRSHFQACCSGALPRCPCKVQGGEGQISVSHGEAGRVCSFMGSSWEVGPPSLCKSGRVTLLSSGRVPPSGRRRLRGPWRQAGCEW